MGTGARRETLVVGAGLSGAVLAFLAARAGDRVTIVSLDRPASRATALCTGVVHGIGPPGEPHHWPQFPAEALADAALRAARGYRLLQDVVLATDRTCGFTRLRHEMTPPNGSDGAWLAATHARLREAGWPVELVTDRQGPRLVRPLDALIHPRRVTFEFVCAAARAGARVRLGVALRSPDTSARGRFVCRLGEEDVAFDVAFWPSAPGGSTGVEGEPAGRARLVLHQNLALGSQRPAAVLSTGDGDLVLLPDPLRQDRLIVVRAASENPDGGLEWPSMPRSWDVFRGRAVRQRLAEAIYAPGGAPPFSRTGPVVRMHGLAGWSIAAVLGACLQAFEHSR